MTAPRPAALLAVTALVAARPAAAHDAFGDLGPFYANLLHPLADPSQAVVLAGFAAVLALHPIAVVRRGWALQAAAGALTVAAVAVLAPPAPPALAVGLTAAGLGAAALAGRRLPGALVVALGIAAAVVAGLAAQRPTGLREALLTSFGGALGLATASLLLWSLFDRLRRRLGDIACAVAGSWVAAIGILTAAVPR
jgi:hypothetical protein